MDSTIWSVVIGSAIGATASLAGTLLILRSTRKQSLEQRLWELRSQTFIDLLAWTAWVEHWYMTGTPDKYERPHTVNMARIAARLSAFDSVGAGELAQSLVTELSPYVTRQDISGHQPPPPHIRAIAQQLTDHARESVSRIAL